jgi:hypothetical protein
MNCKRPREENRERTTNRIGEQTELEIDRTEKRRTKKHWERKNKRIGRIGE